MKISITNCFTKLVFIGLIGCTYGNNKTSIVTNNEPANYSVDTLNSDSTILIATLNKEDTAFNEYLSDVLKPIRANFKKLNSFNQWDSIMKKDLWETTEGGIATYFYLKGNVEKIITRNYGETFQRLTEYYVLNGQLSFVFDRMYKYNRPLLYDSAAMKESNDDQIFDFNKSVLEETRSYFTNGKLIHQINNEDCGSPFSEEYLQEEEKLLQASFKKLRNIAKEF